MVRAPARRLLLHHIHSINRGVLLWFAILGSKSLFNHLQPSNCFRFLEHTVKASERSTIHVKPAHSATRNKELDFCGGYRCIENAIPELIPLRIGFGMGRC